MPVSGTLTKPFRKTGALALWNPTIGLVLCSEKSEAVVKHSVLSEQKQLFAAKYMAYLPTEEELKRELERERAVLSRKLKRVNGK